MESDEDANMDDLLLETFSALENGTGNDDLAIGGEPSSETSDMEGDDEKTERFLAEVERIKEDMDWMEQLLTKLQEINEKSEGVERAPTMKARPDRRDADIAQVSKLARGVEAKLEDLDRANSEEGTPTDGTRMTSTNNLRTKLKEIMGQFQALRGRIVNEDKETIKRRYSIAMALLFSPDLPKKKLGNCIDQIEHEDAGHYAAGLVVTLGTLKL